MFNRDKDTQAMVWFDRINDSMYRYKNSGVRYAEGSWGYTVLRTAYSDESDTLWPIGLENLRRWVTQYFVHLNRLAANKSDGSVNDELGRRFIIEEVDVDSEKLNVPDLGKASQDDIKALTNVFYSWLRSAVDVEGNAEFNIQDSARFCDFLVIDEGSLRSLAALPKETPPLGLVSRQERRDRDILYCYSYVWLVDSQAVKRFQGVENGDNYDGWMKLCPDDIPEAWATPATRSQNLHSRASAALYPENPDSVYNWTSIAAGTSLCLAPQNGESATNTTIPGATTIPADAQGYNHYISDPPEGATVSAGRR
ncbi:hypothetical protein V502_07060 [Pseudogymnoascus sp. VKM F-4520 (FW-2644)]|nr:hypothetical protein V502_07060 [Pseudogymnoascus sp. VKM F-4520 (FW-2644)]